MSKWDEQELDRISGANELRIRPSDPAGSSTVPIWVVRLGDDLYIRSYRGTAGGWYRRASQAGRARIEAGGVRKPVVLEGVATGMREAIDDAYRRKYGRGPYVDAMITSEAVATTTRLIPATGRITERGASDGVE